MPHPPPKPGFTLAELLIALALLGIIAAFTIPKVLQSSSEAETNAKLRETVASLEDAWYGIKAQNQVPGGGTLYGAIVPRLNTAAAGGDRIISLAPTGPFAAGHPCLSPSTAWGWVQFANGVVISGLAEDIMGGYDRDLDLLSPLDPSHNDNNNYALCIDVNGAASPNLPGQDVFYGNFNQYGSFAGVPASEQQTLKAFRWGNNGSAADSDVFGSESNGILTVAGFPNVGDGDGFTPCANVGCRLTR